MIPVRRHGCADSAAILPRLREVRRRPFIPVSSSVGWRLAGTALPRGKGQPSGLLFLARSFCMNDHLRQTLKQLRLSGLLESLEVRLQEAASHHLNHAEFLELILQDELAVRSERLLNRRIKAAGFRELKTLEDFDWAFNPSVKKKQVFDLATGHFIREHRDVLWLGPPGVGKSHLVQALGYQALKAGFVVLYRSIFDLVRDFLHDEAVGWEDKILNRYLKPDLLIIDKC